jgi:hypothetical protein
MNSETIYNVLLDQPRSIDGKTWHGLSYQLSRDEDGKVELREHGWPTKLALWEQDGPELDTLDEATVKGMIEAALPVDESYVIPPPPVPYVEKFTAEQIVSQYFSAYQIAALQRLEMALLQANKPLGPQMSAAKQWLESVMLGWAVDPTAKPAGAFGVPSVSFEEASGEAVAGLQAGQNPET